MKKITLLFSFILLSFSGFAQDNCPEPSAIHITQGNNIQATVNNGGYPFYDGGNSESFISTVNNDNAASSIYLAGLWIGALDQGGNLKISASSYGGDAFNAGPLVTVVPDSLTCVNWDKIWVVSYTDILLHQADFGDNGVIDAPISSIFGWPANGNENFEPIEGFPLPETDASLAPFFDLNQDGLYQPENGEFPLPNNVSELAIPQEITYSLFNDVSFSNNQNFDPLKFQIGQTTYTYDCPTENPLNNTIFVSFQMTNKGMETLDSMAVGMFIDFDLGCYEDDFVGSDPTRNAFFAYNTDNTDGNENGDCSVGSNSYGENPPVQAITFLNKPLSSFTYHRNSSLDGATGTHEPDAAIEYYRYLTGRWKDGSQLEFGGDGYQEVTVPVNHAFPNDPNDADGWSMITANMDNSDYRVVGNSKIGEVQPGQSFSLDMAFTFVRESGLSNLENVTEMYNQIEEIQNAYDLQFSENCMPTAVTNVAAKDHNFKIFPNPATDVLTIELPDFDLTALRIIDVTGKIILEKRGQFSENIQLSLDQFSKGIYFLQMESGTQQFYEKISLQ